MLAGLEGMFHKKWNDLFGQILGPTNPECHAVPVIDTDHTATEERLERVQNLDVSFVLDHGELRQDLNSRSHIAVSVDPDVEAPFAIHKAYDPLGIELHPERTRT